MVTVIAPLARVPARTSSLFVFQQTPCPPPTIHYAHHASFYRQLKILDISEPDILINFPSSVSEQLSPITSKGVFIYQKY